MSHAVTYEGSQVPVVRSYKAGPGPYKVILSGHGYNDEIGPADVRQISDNAFEVTPRFEIAFPAEDCTFWGGFAADENGNAVLDAVYLVVREPQ